MKTSAATRWAGPLVAIGLVAGFGWAATDIHPESSGLPAIGAGFKMLAPQPLAAPADMPLQSVRDVHPSLARISGWISSVGASAALGDADGDGLSNNLCLVDPRTDQVTLEPVPRTSAADGNARYARIVLDTSRLPYDRHTMAPMGCMFTDANEDGWADFVVYYWGRTPVVFLQVAAARSATPLTRASFVAVELLATPERWFTNAATSADFDGDGHVDLVFANYFHDGADILNAHGTGTQSMHDTKAKSFTGGRKHFLLWKRATGGSEPSVAFEHVTPFADEALDRGWTLAVGAADLDGDQLPEIYFANDFGPDRLLHNRSTPGKLAFAVVEGNRGLTTPKSAVLGRDSFKGMGVDFADVNGDGRLDIFVSNIAARYSLQESHMMWMNTDAAALGRGEAPFVQGSEALGLSRSGWGWDAKFADLNNDGSLELIQATGFLKGKVNRWAELQALATSNDQIMSNPGFWPRFRPGDDLSGHQPNPIFARDATGRFFDIAGELGLDAPYVTRAIAVADVDGDGALDLVYGNQWEPSVYVHNECRNCGEFVGLHVLRQPGAGEAASVVPGLGADLHLSPAIGAAVTVTMADGRKFVAQVDGGNGHSGRRSPDLHFGLGHSDSSGPIQVEISWRTRQGERRSAKVPVARGWNTVLLAS